MGLVDTTTPSIQPVKREELKTQLAISSGKWDSFLDALIETATLILEKEADLRLLTRTLVWTQDRFPSGGSHGGFGGGRGVLYLPVSPVSSVTSVKYIDTAGVEQTLDPSEFDVDTTHIQARLRPAESHFWPTLENTLEAVKIEFVAGHGDARDDVPRPLRQAILMAAGDMFENRESQVAEAFTFKVNPTFTKIMSLYALRYHSA